LAQAVTNVFVGFPIVSSASSFSMKSHYWSTVNQNGSGRSPCMRRLPSLDGIAQRCLESTTSDDHVAQTAQNHFSTTMDHNATRWSLNMVRLHSCGNNTLPNFDTRISGSSHESRAPQAAQTTTRDCFTSMNNSSRRSLCMSQPPSFGSMTWPGFDTPISGSWKEGEDAQAAQTMTDQFSTTMDTNSSRQSLFLARLPSLDSTTRPELDASPSDIRQERTVRMDRLPSLSSIWRSDSEASISDSCMEWQTDESTDEGERCEIHYSESDSTSVCDDFDDPVLNEKPAEPITTKHNSFPMKSEFMPLPPMQLDARPYTLKQFRKGRLLGGQIPAREGHQVDEDASSFPDQFEDQNNEASASQTFVLAATSISQSSCASREVPEWEDDAISQGIVQPVLKSVRNPDLSLDP